MIFTTMTTSAKDEFNVLQSKILGCLPPTHAFYFQFYPGEVHFWVKDTDENEDILRYVHKMGPNQDGPEFILEAHRVYLSKVVTWNATVPQQRFDYLVNVVEGKEAAVVDENHREENNPLNKNLDKLSVYKNKILRNNPGCKTMSWTQGNKFFIALVDDQNKEVERKEYEVDKVDEISIAKCWELAADYFAVSNN